MMKCAMTLLLAAAAIGGNGCDNSSGGLQHQSSAGSSRQTNSYQPAPSNAAVAGTPNPVTFLASSQWSIKSTSPPNAMA